MSLEEITEVTITAATAAPSRVGYGTPCVMAYHTNYTERAREYTSVAGMLTDGFVAGEPAVLAVGALLAQNPKPSKVVVGREVGTEEKLIKLTPVAVASTAYAVVLNGQTASYTSDATPTIAEITAGLKVAIDALGENVTTTDNTTDLDVEADTVADNFSLYTVNRTLIGMNDNTPDGAVSIATDIAAVQVENDDMFSIHLTNQGKAVITAAATYVSTLYKMLFVSSPDTDIYGVSTTDIASNMQTAGHDRVVLMYHPKANVQFPDCAWAGRCLPLDAGSITWMFKSLNNVDYINFTPSEESKIKAKNCNMYVRIAGVSMTQYGVASSGKFIDLTRSTDWIRSQLKETVFGSFVRADKIPQTNKGIAVVEGDVKAVLKKAINQTILTDNPAPTTQVLDIRDVPIADRALRNLPDVKFTGQFAGAFHKVQISGTVSV